MSLIKGIGAARRSVEIVIFRFDQREIERALANAVNRGVAVRALIAHTNRAGEESLRKLEMRLLEAGVVVARTADDLVRYHGKMMVTDRHELYLLAFNPTYADIDHSRSFGLITRSPSVVREALKLFDADTQRRPYEAGLASFVVSPSNARKQLAGFIKGAKKELLIYDPTVSDAAMIRLLEERSKAGVEIRIIGRMPRRSPGLTVRKLPQMRLHARTMVRDGKLAFIGSQSLREIELDARREVGIIFRDAAAVSGVIRTFENDWALADPTGKQVKAETAPAAKVAKKVAKAVIKDLPAVAPVLNGAVKEVVGSAATVDLSAEEVQEIVKDAIKDAVREAVRGVVEEVVELDGRAR
jgi:phosphatidylserine/phosphatidylglycerophosphate/cardiolipin synthase-like enzyme